MSPWVFGGCCSSAGDSAANSVELHRRDEGGGPPSCHTRMNERLSDAVLPPNPKRAPVQIYVSDGAEIPARDLTSQGDRSHRH